MSLRSQQRKLDRGGNRLIDNILGENDDITVEADILDVKDTLSPTVTNKDDYYNQHLRELNYSNKSSFGHATGKDMGDQLATYATYQNYNQRVSEPFRNINEEIRIKKKTADMINTDSYKQQQKATRNNKVSSGLEKDTRRKKVDDDSVIVLGGDNENSLSFNIDENQFTSKEH